MSDYNDSEDDDEDEEGFDINGNKDDNGDLLLYIKNLITNKSK